MHWTIELNRWALKNGNNLLGFENRIHLMCFENWTCFGLRWKIESTWTCLPKPAWLWKPPYLLSFNSFGPNNAGLLCYRVGEFKLIHSVLELKNKWGWFNGTLNKWQHNTFTFCYSSNVPKNDPCYYFCVCKSWFWKVSIPFCWDVFVVFTVIFDQSDF